MLSSSSDFVKVLLPRDIMLQANFVNPGRSALPADLHLTRCPNPKLLRLPSADAGHPRSGGYAERRVLVGCRDKKCGICQQDAIVKRILTWSQRLRALLSYEVEKRGSELRLITLTFPPHPDGNPELKGAPSEDMLQDAWHGGFLVDLHHWYRNRCSPVDLESDGDTVQVSGLSPFKAACNIIGVVEDGTRNGRLHLHVVYAARPGFPHPWQEGSPEMLSTLDRYGNRQFLDGLGKVWREVLRNRGYEELQNWYNAPPESIGGTVGYLTSYLSKGFLADKTYRVRAGRQNPKWPEITEWWRDKRFNLQDASYRRWVGFKVHINEINEGNIREECKRLGRYYASEYNRGVTVGGKRVSVDGDSLALHLLLGIDNHIKDTFPEHKRDMGQAASLPISIEFKPVLIALADREVRHPARADYLSVANYYPASDTIGAPEVIENPGDLVQEDSRYNLCGASHWFPMDGTELQVRGTEAFEEIVGWNLSVVSKFNDVVTDILNASLPGTAWSFIMQGLESPVNVVDMDRVRRVSSAFPEVFPDSIMKGLTQPAYARSLPVKAVSPGDVHPDIAYAMEKCVGYSALTDIRACDATTTGNWPFFFLKQGQVAIIRNIAERTRSGIYNLPTSFGKSLCYQLPHVAGGITLVVSPLLSLIRDQYQGLKKRGVNATWVGGQHNKKRKETRLGLVGAINRTVDNHCIVYVSPESFDVNPPPDRHGVVHERYLAQLLRTGRLNISHLVVDEAHCITEWSDFRPAYQGIPKAVSTWLHPPKVVSLFSATVSPRILYDLRGVFPDDDFDFVSLPMVRDNLFLRRRPVGFYDFFAVEWHRVVKSPALIYCGQRARTEEVASFLRNQGVKAVHYHAGLSTDKRESVEDNFRDGKVDVLCATIAFGMGVDIRNIRTVIHDCYPQTLEDYVQQLGRAGRDSLPSECILLYNPGMVESPDMHSYFHSDGCLWSHISLHHGQPASPCGHCDGCKGTESFIPE